MAKKRPLKKRATGSVTSVRSATSDVRITVFDGSANRAWNASTIANTFAAGIVYWEDNGYLRRGAVLAKLEKAIRQKREVKHG